MESKNDIVIDLTKEYIKDAVEVSARAFQDGITLIHMYPDENERKRKIGYGFEAMFKYGIKFGMVHTTSPNLEGNSIWLPPKKVYTKTLSFLRHGGFKVIRKTGFKPTKRIFPLFNCFENAHKRHAPFDHWYLQHLAVDPVSQGKGYGSLLMQKALDLIDEQRLPAYTEINKEINVKFYQKHGFQVLEYKIVPKTEVPVWCMLRNARD